MIRISGQATIGVCFDLIKGTDFFEVFLVKL